jgi:serine/threonine protein kinase/Tol biopolymer transport system component
MADSLQRLNAALSDRYRLERELGQGGMATVYLAHDLKHDRDVAIKVLHPDLAAALGAERFLSEIKTTARLQHPHILPLLDSGEADGMLYYVMPYVSGETLRTRLEREKQLPIGDALRIAAEVADALAAAHALGIIHRDIKPENILLQGGHALVADFGIALAVHHAGTARMTQTGVSLGTPQYMSPEQAMGEKNVDARADVYALGAVTYEMLCGEPPFTGSTVQAIVAKLMTDPARPLTQLRKSVPLHVEAAVLAALEKVPADRVPSAAAFGQALGDATFTTRGAPTGARPRTQAGSAGSRRALLVAVAFNLLLVAGALFLWARRPAPPSTSRQHVLLWQHAIPYPLAPGARFVGSQAAIAPDGSSIVFTDSTSGGYRLMRKLGDAGEATPLAGTEGGVSPFFSPDGKWVGYVTLDNRLKKVPVTGGGSVTLAEDINPDYKTGAWLDDGTIVYGDNAAVPLSRIPAAGGPAVRHGPPNRLGFAFTLAPLPGSRGFLFTACPGNCSLASNVYVYDFAADSARELVRGAAGVAYSPTGHLLYTSREGGLYAMGFDARRLTVTSGAVPILEDVEPASFTLSASGEAIYSTGSAARSQAELVWVTRDGRTAPYDSTWKGRFEYPKLSPDATELAVSVRDKTTDLWIRRANGAREKVSADGAANWRASWFPDGHVLTFVSVRNAEVSNDVVVYKVATDGSARPELLQQEHWGVWEAEVSPDGQWLVLRMDEEGGNSNLRYRRLTGDTTLRPLLVDPSFDLSIALSPDGHWLAYTTNETAGQYEVYVSSFPDMNSKRMVSSGGGTEPRWSRNGRELYYVSGGRLMAVAVPPGPSFSPGRPEALFSVEGYRRARNHQQYDVAPDGRFVMIREAPGGSGAIHAEHWLAELLAKVNR